MPDSLEHLFLELVLMRLDDPAYLQSEAYGQTLLSCFHRCQEELPSGYAAFHLPWVLEWYEGNRQYKQAFELMKRFHQTRQS